MDSLPWVEKYRPRKISDLIVDDVIGNKLKSVLEEKSIPNMLITGIPGIGKTTTILCLARHMTGKYYSDAVLEINASDTRGIKYVQDTISNFCKKRVLDEDNNVVHKVLLLDEADNMTPKAQQVISDLMEKYSNTTTFTYTCNSSANIVESIQSRCIIVRYQRISNEKIVKRLEQICEIEKVEYTNDGLDMLAVFSEGDLRNAINMLQITSTRTDKVTKATVCKIHNKPYIFDLIKIVKLCGKKELRLAIDEMKKIINEGYSPFDIVMDMVNVLKTYELLSKDDLDEAKRIEMIKRTGVTVVAINKGIASSLQLIACIARLCDI